MLRCVGLLSVHVMNKRLTNAFIDEFGICEGGIHLTNEQQTNDERKHLGLLTNSVDVDRTANANRSFNSKSVAIRRVSVHQTKFAFGVDVLFSVHCCSAGYCT